MTLATMATDPAPDSAPAEGLRLGDVVRAIPGARLVGVGGESARVRGVRQDSRTVEPGDLFVARAGERTDGTRFIGDAVRRGATALVCQPGQGGAFELPRIEVEDVRGAIALAARAVYGDPTAAMDVVGITGTNGKTTTAALTRAALTAVGGSVGVVGTLGVQFRGSTRPTAHTSPEADELMRIAKGLRDDGATHLVMEVSSIALAAARVLGVRFRVAALTNLSQDHLDYHGTMAAYAASKRRLFTEFDVPAVALNVDDPFGAELVPLVAGARLARTSAKADTARSDAELIARSVTASEMGQRIEVETPAGRVVVDSHLVGAHNVENVLTALSICWLLDVDLTAAAEGLSQPLSVAGRMERCDSPGQDDVVVIVDYAHTPDALARVLRSVQGIGRGRVICVFGCGGDRDADKRPQMGAAAGRLADHCIVTNDNPRSESPQTIADQIRPGLDEVGARYEVELDRRRAIHRAIAMAVAGDVVVVAGKGHEPYQIVGERTLSFDDRAEARAALLERRGASGGQS